MPKKEVVVFRTKLGTAKKVERSRIWIEGQRLIDAGFSVGSYFMKDWDDDAPKFERPILELMLLKGDEILGMAPCKVSGKGAKPIIDITGELVYTTFGRHGAHVDVQFRQGRIVVTKMQARFDAVVRK